MSGRHRLGPDTTEFEPLPPAGTSLLMVTVLDEVTIIDDCVGGVAYRYDITAPGIRGGWALASLLEHIHAVCEVESTSLRVDADPDVADIIHAAVVPEVPAEPELPAPEPASRRQIIQVGAAAAVLAVAGALIMVALPTTEQDQPAASAVASTSLRPPGAPPRRSATPAAETMLPGGEPVDMPVIPATSVEPVAEEEAPAPLLTVIEMPGEPVAPAAPEPGVPRHDFGPFSAVVPPDAHFRVDGTTTIVVGEDPDARYWFEIVPLGDTSAQQWWEGRDKRIREDPTMTVTGPRDGAFTYTELPADGSHAYWHTWIIDNNAVSVACQTRMAPAEHHTKMCADIVDSVRPH